MTGHLTRLTKPTMTCGIHIGIPTHHLTCTNPELSHVFAARRSAWRMVILCMQFLFGVNLGGVADCTLWYLCRSCMLLTRLTDYQMVSHGFSACVAVSAMPAPTDNTQHDVMQVPKALEQLFASNYDMLLSIFNPEGWLDITYVDSTHRVGRDDKGNVYYLQRS